MQIEYNKLMVRDFYEKFDEEFIVKGNLILDNLIVYGVDENGFAQEKVDFLISRKSGNNIIVPLRNYNKYVLITEKLEKCDVINICANEFVGESKTESRDRIIFLDSGGDKDG